MSGAGHAQVADRDSFLQGAVNAAQMNIEGEDDRAGPAVPKNVQMVRPGTTPYQGSKHGVTKTKKPKKKKKTMKKKVTASVPVIDDHPTYEDPDNPSLDDIERAKAILAKAKASGDPFVEHINDPPPEETTHTSVAEQFSIDDIDDEMQKDPAVLKGTKTVTPPHLMEHECGLPTALMDRKSLTKYLGTHGIDHAIREQIEITTPELALYDDFYAKAMKHKRVTLGHFVSALRLWRNGYPINPKASVDINSMKVHA